MKGRPMPNSNGDQEHDHASVSVSEYGSLKDLMRGIAEHVMSHDPEVEAMSGIASKALSQVLAREYAGLYQRTRELDRSLSEQSMLPTPLCAEAYALHVLAEDQAEKLARVAYADTDDETGRATTVLRTEYDAQKTEHRAQLKRWAMRLADAIKSEHGAAKEKTPA